MKRFRFPLQPVTTVRQWRERDAREQFAGRVQALAAADEVLRAARQRLADLEQVLRGARSSQFRPAEHAAALAAYQDEQTAVQRATVARAEAQSALDRARELWQGRRAELRAVEQLEVRARQAHRLHEERAEQNALDELASVRGARTNPVLS